MPVNMSNMTDMRLIRSNVDFIDQSLDLSDEGDESYEYYEDMLTNETNATDWATDESTIASLIDVQSRQEGHFTGYIDPDYIVPDPDGNEGLSEEMKHGNKGLSGEVKDKQPDGNKGLTGEVKHIH